MNVNRNLLSAAVASTLLASAGTASAVHLSETGLGQVALFPYYSVRSVDGNAFNTYLHLVNTTDSPKAVKVRFREAKNSREVLDFNLYLSARDVWVGSVEPTADGAKIVAYDNSCTAPAIPAAGEAFRNYRYTNTALGNQADGAGTSLDRTREGYIEVIEMGVPRHRLLKDGTTFFDDAITHGATGVPANCAEVINSWKGTDNQGTGSFFAGITDELAPATGGLTGSSVLINVGNGTAYANEPVVLDSFWLTTLTDGTHNYPGTELPSLVNAAPNSQIYGGGTTVVSSTWVNGVSGDAVSAVLMRDSVINEYSVNPNTAAKTDWVVTFPTKSLYVTTVTAQDNLADRPFTKNFVTDGTGACESVGMQYWDREEQTYSPGGGIDFSPQLPGAAGPALCWEANVITFKQNGAGDTYTGVLGSAVQADLELATGFTKGWMQLTFEEANAADDGAGTTMADDLGQSYFGLPVIGYAVKSVVNGAVTAGVLANYGSEAAHKYTRDLVDDAPAN